MKYSIAQKEIDINLHIPPGITTLFHDNEIKNIVHAQQFTSTYVGDDNFSLYFTNSPSALSVLENHVSALSTKLFLSNIPHSLSITENTSTTVYSSEDVERSVHHLYWFSEDLEEHLFLYKKIPLRPVDILEGDALNINTSVQRAVNLFKNLDEYYRLSDNQVAYLSAIKAKQILNN